METIDTYIVRIYRRDLNEPRSIAGFIEIVGSDEKKAFASQEELLRILIPKEKSRNKIPEKVI